MLSCYFPLVFTPRPGDPDTVSREALAAALQASLTASPVFAPMFVPLALEKLTSTLKCGLLRAKDCGHPRWFSRPAMHDCPSVPYPT